jgi:plastocyanin
MKYNILLCGAVIAFLLITGCTQMVQQGQPVVTATPAPAVSPSVTPTSAPISAITTQPSVSGNTIIIQKMAFMPAQITVSAGTTVRWVNKDTVTHSVLFPPSARINSFALSPGQSFTARFSTPGIYNYSCSIYSSMQGSVVVTP